MYKILSIESRLSAIFFIGASKNFGPKLPDIETFCKDNGISRRSLYNLYFSAIRVLEEHFTLRTPGPKVNSCEVKEPFDPRIFDLAAELKNNSGITATFKEKVVLLGNELKKNKKITLGQYAKLTGIDERSLRIWRKNYDGTTESLEDKRIKKIKTEVKNVSQKNGFKKLFSGAQILMDTTVLKIWGIVFYIIAAMDACTKQILSIKVFQKESADKIIKTLKSAIKKLPVCSVVFDHGRPYISRKTRNFLNRNNILRILCAPYHPQSKGAIERFFRTLKSWIRQPLKLVIQLILLLLCKSAAKKHNFKKPYNNLVHERIDDNFHELETRSTESLRKKEIIQVIIDSTFLNGKKPPMKNLQKYPLSLLIDAYDRLNMIRKKEGPESSKNTGAYFIGILNNLIPAYEAKRLKEQKKKNTEILALRRKQQEEILEQRRNEFRKNHPEESLLEYILAMAYALRFSYLPVTLIGMVLQTWQKVIEKYGVAFKSISEILDVKIHQIQDVNEKEKAFIRKIISELISNTEIKNKKLIHMIKNPKAEFHFDDTSLKEIFNQRSIDL